MVSYLYSYFLACDFANQKEGHWTPVLAVLCDGANFEFFVMDSADKVIFTSGWREGLLVQPENKSRFLMSVKKSKQPVSSPYPGIVECKWILAYCNSYRTSV